MKNIRIYFLDVNKGFGLAAGNFRSSQGYGNSEVALPQGAFKIIDIRPNGTLKSFSTRNLKGLPEGIAMPGSEKSIFFQKKPKNHEKKYFFHQPVIVFP